MTVDLSIGNQGVITFSGGEQFFSTVVVRSGDHFLVRYESGWYTPYKQDGKRIRAGWIINPDGTEQEFTGGDERNVVQFQPITWQQALEKYPEIQAGISP